MIPMDSPDIKTLKEGVGFFLHEIEEEATVTLASRPTKQDMTDALKLILHYVGTIKGIIT